MDIFNRVVKWNEDRNNTNFNLGLEVRMLAEELYEMCGYKRETAKEAGKKFSREYAVSLTEVLSKDRVDSVADAAGDLIFIAIGTIMKLGLDPKEVMTRICDANDKKGSKKDADGKIIKNADFVEPVHV